MSQCCFKSNVTKFTFSHHSDNHVLKRLFIGKDKGKAVPLQVWSGPEGSRKLVFPDFMTTAQDGGKVVSLTHRPTLLTHSTVQSPYWEANWFAASQEIPRISPNPKVHYRTHKRPPPVPILGQPNPVHIPTSHLIEIHPNIIHPSTPRSSHWSPPLQFPQQDPIHHPFLTHTRHMPSPSYSPTAFTSRKYSWYSFLLETESTSGP